MWCYARAPACGELREPFGSSAKRACGLGARSVVAEGKRGVAAGAGAPSPRAVKNRARATAWGSWSESALCLKVLRRVERKN